MHSHFISPSGIPSEPLSLKLKGKLVSLTRPLVMGILNLTPDSFYAGSRTLDASEAVSRVGRMIEDGADIIDIGACSTRPGSVSPSCSEELQRLETPMEAIRKAFPDAAISIDTFRAAVASECLERWDADIINDVSGGEDPDMFRTVARYGAAYVLMHKRGTPSDMDSMCDYDDVVADVASELAFRLSEARLAGICDVIVDPGFGFAKTPNQNLELLRRLDWLKVLGCPILAGMSRKRMTKVSDRVRTAEAMLTATVALNAVAIEKGASIIRVHDVAEAAVTAETIGRLWNLG